VVFSFQDIQIRTGGQSSQKGWLTECTEFHGINTEEGKDKTFAFSLITVDRQSSSQKGSLTECTEFHGINTEEGKDKPFCLQPDYCGPSVVG
jgi:hypothetical protein